MPWLNSQTRPHTRSCYERDAERLLAHAGKSLKAIGLGDLQKFECLADRGRLGSRLSRPHACCDKSLYSFCCRTRHLATNPASEMSLPLYEKRLAERIMTEEDIARVLGAEMPARDRALLKLLYFSGLRVSEACGLRWRNVRQHGNSGQISVLGKGGKRRSIAINREICIELFPLRSGCWCGRTPTLWTAVRRSIWCTPPSATPR